MVIRTLNSAGSNDSLLPSQKNVIFKIIKNTQLDPNDFEWRSVQDGQYEGITVDQLRHKSSNFFFTFGKNRDAYRTEDFYVRYSPAQNKMYGASSAYDWESVSYEVVDWIDRLKREWEAPDLWGQAQSGNFDSASSLPNTKFSKSELTTVKIRMEDIRRILLQSVDGDAIKSKDVNEKIDYLVEQASKQGRRDWLMLVYGYIFTNIVNWGLNPDHFHAIVHLLITGLQVIGEHL
jgi:hypothetical protein